MLNKFPGLQINITGGAYIRFASAYAQSVFAANWGDGTGLSTPQAQAITNLNNKFQNLTTAFTLDELKYMINLTWLRVKEFSGCTGLTAINLVNITFLDGPTGTAQGDYQDGAFKSCTGLITVSNVDNITTVNNNCFWNCSNLTTITGTWHVSVIPIALFGKCNKLTGILITSACTTIKDSAFFDDNKLVSLGDTSGLTVIEHNAFYNCTKLASIDTSNCTAIGSSSDQGGNNSASTFWRCRALTSLNLTKITIVQPGCFYQCSGLTSIILSALCTSIGRASFMDCTALQTLGDTSGITFLDSYAFYNCSSLVSANFPSVTAINGEGTFHYCNALTSIVLDNCTTIYGDDCEYHANFANCTSLVHLSLPKCTSLGGYNFYNATSLKTIDLPLVTSLEYCVFQNCSSLVNLNDADINVPSITSIKSNAFDSCSSLRHFTVNKNVTLVDGGAFSNLNSNFTLVFEEGGTSLALGSKILEHSNYSKVLTLPAHTTSMASGCLRSSGITALVCKATTPPTANSDIQPTGNIYVPDDSVSAYKAATTWSSYSSRIFSLTQFAIDFPNG